MTDEEFKQLLPTLTLKQKIMILRGPGGEDDFDNEEDDEFDIDELEAGIEIETEHTNDEEIAKIITKDHLTETPDYYTRLIKMEKKAKDFWDNEEY